MPKRSHRLSVAFIFAVCLSIGLSNATPAAAQEKIAFGSNRNGEFDIYLMNPDGTEQTRLTTHPARDQQPSFSSDGSKILFYSHRDGSTSEIYVMNSDGTAQTRLTNSPGNDFRPSFSPDGTRIAFHSNRDGDFEIYIMNSDGSDPTQLTQNRAFDIGASLSPDGSRIVFTSNRDPGGLTGNYEIYVMNADGTGQTRLTNDPAFDSGAEFSPDGSKIVFYSSRDGNEEIYLMNPDGSDPTRLTNSPGNDRDPAFSPDGSQIAFTSTRDGHEEIYVMNLDGTGQTARTNNLADDAAAAWGRLGPSPGRLLNISTRLGVGTGENALIGGFIITGTEPKKVIIRAIGPSLASQGVAGVLENPILQLFDSAGEPIAFNDNWRESQEAEIEASTIPPSNDLESAIVRTLSPGHYTAVVRGAGEATGIGLVEVYDLGQAAQSTLANISSRGFVETGENVMIGGFIVSSGGTRVVIRAMGPSLESFGIAGALQDPTLDLVNSNGVVLRANNDWRDAQQAEIEATGLQPGDTRESTLIETLAPGNYTAIVRGAGNTTGVGLVEVYNLQ